NAGRAGTGSDPAQAIPFDILSAASPVLTNDLATGAVITATPTVDSSFCGKTVALGGSIQYTLTVGAATGFPSRCGMVVMNVDPVPSSGGRGKKMAVSGLTFPFNSLYPGQSFVLLQIGNAWKVAGLSRYKLAASQVLTLFTDFINGNDSND